LRAPQIFGLEKRSLIMMGRAIHLSPDFQKEKKRPGGPKTFGQFRIGAQSKSAPLPRQSLGVGVTVWWGGAEKWENLATKNSCHNGAVRPKKGLFRGYSGEVRLSN